MMSKEDWIACGERYPDMELSYSGNLSNGYISKEQLVQTKMGDLFLAYCEKTVFHEPDRKDKYEWFSYGTGGRKMRVMSTVIAWQPLPGKYEG